MKHARGASGPFPLWATRMTTALRHNAAPHFWYCVWTSSELPGLDEAQLAMIGLSVWQKKKHEVETEVSDKRNFLFLKVATYSNISTKGIPFQVREGGEVPDPQNIKVLILAGVRGRGEGL